MSMAAMPQVYLKGSLYAKAGILDYWIINLVARQLEVYRQPMLDDSAVYGFRYLYKAIVLPGDTVAPLARQDRTVAVANLLP